MGLDLQTSVCAPLGSARSFMSYSSPGLPSAVAAVLVDVRFHGDPPSAIPIYIASGARGSLPPWVGPFGKLHG